MKESEVSLRRGRECRSGTRLLAALCHGCGVCPYAERRPESRFGQLMRWHRTWCPAWAAHTKVYGPKSLTRT